MPMIQATEHETLESLVAQSLVQHEQMIGLLGELHDQLSTQSADFVDKFNESFSALQKEAQQTDQQLIARLNLSDISERTRQHLARRKLLQEGVLHLLKDSVPKARNIMSLLASEMQSLKAGRRALHGYKNASDRQGTIINRVR